MEFLNELGFNATLFVAQIINFVIIFFILKKIMYKPVLDIIQKRDKEIKKGFKDKEDAEIMLQQAEEKEVKIISNAQKNAEKIVSDAKLEANEAKAQIEEGSKKEAERIINQARETIAQESKIAEDHLTNKIGTIAIGLVEKSLKGVFGKKEQGLILKKAETELRKLKVV